MSSQGALTERGGEGPWRARWRRAWSSLGTAIARPRLRLRLRTRAAFRPSGRQLSRRLGPLERTLARESPELAGLFGVFTQLAEGEPAGGVEQLPAKPFPRPRPAAVAVLLALASIIALCLTLSTQVTPVKSCSQPTTAAAAVPNSVAVVPGISCASFPVNK